MRLAAARAALWGVAAWGLLASCAPGPAPSAPSTELRVLHVFQGKVEIADALKKMAEAYAREHSDVRIEVETVGGGQDYDAALADRSQSGALPDVFMSIGWSNMDLWVNDAEDLSAEAWVKDLRPGTADPVTRNGKILGNPLAIEGYGFLYNKALFRKAGITRLPDTLSSLEDACRKLQGAGILPFSNGYAEWWVLGIHNLNILLGHAADHRAFTQRLASGAGPGPDAAAVEGWMDLLDLTRRYGADDATVAGDYTASVGLFLAGGAAMVQQGNWIEPDLLKSAPDLEVGVLPMPVSEVPDRRVPMGVPNFWVINKNSPRKQDAKDWIEWMRTSPKGQKFLLNELRVIPPYLSLMSRPVGPLSAPFAAAWDQGRTLPWLFPRYLDKTKPVAAVLRTYLEHRESHAALWKHLGEVWAQP